VSPRILEFMRAAAGEGVDTGGETLPGADSDDADRFASRYGPKKTSPMAFALNPHELPQMPGGWGQLWIGGDASGSGAQMGDVVAAIDYDAETWHAEHMNLYAGALGRACGNSTHEDMRAEEFIIFVKEGHLWTNRIASRTRRGATRTWCR
jgi:hypothetical protein